MGNQIPTHFMKYQFIQQFIKQKPKYINKKTKFQPIPFYSEIDKIANKTRYKLDYRKWVFLSEKKLPGRYQ